MRARTAAENPRLSRGTAPHPPPAAATGATSTMRPLRYRAFRCSVRGCTAVVSLTEHDAMPDGWHVAVPAGKGDPVYTCDACSTRAGLTVAPPVGLPAMDAGELADVRAAQLAQLADIRAGIDAFMAELGERGAA